MYIYSFDCATKNLGFCCIYVDEHWRAKVSKIINELYAIYEDPPELDVLLSRVAKILTQINQILDNIFRIEYINVFDLVPGAKASTVKYNVVLKRLKYVIYCLEKQLPKPDVVLIEYQMNINDKARGVSRYIEEHYTVMGGFDDIPDGQNGIEYGLEAYPLILADFPDDLAETIVHIVSPGVKNSYDLDQSLTYAYYISTKSTNYEANKAHSVANLKAYLAKHQKLDIIKNCSVKLDDLADSFMMAYAWCVKTGLIDLGV